jgi:dTDP-4-dehydrorhamnose 3,5-epimerase-like enzyme
VYDPATEFGVNPFDEEIGIDWPISDKTQLVVSDRDRQHGSLSSIKQG